MNIIMIVVDTLRYDYIAANGNPWIETPNMDRLADRSWVFDRCFTASYPTIPHRTDLMTGRYGGPFHPWRPLPHDARTAPEMLADAGYCTQLIHDTPHLVNGGHNFDWPFHAWHFIRGAEVDRPWIRDDGRLPPNWARDPLFDFVDWESAFEDFRIPTYAWANADRHRYEDWNAAQLFLTASQWLRDNASRDSFFLWLDCFDPHEPWDVPPEYMLRVDDTPGYDGRLDPRAFSARNHPDLPDEARQRIEATYAAKVLWVDHWLGEVLRALDETALWEKTAILFTADHGTNVGERNRFGKGYPVREQEGHVPLFVHVPSDPGGRCDAIVQPQDIFATLLALGGLDMPADLDAHNVLPLAREGIDGPRPVGLAGHGADAWRRSLEADAPTASLFTLFAEDGILEYALHPAQTRFVPYGSLDDLSSHHPGRVRDLRAIAVEEIARRGADPLLVDWLLAEGDRPFPEGETCRFWDDWPGPANYTQYFNRLCVDWRTD